MNMSQAQTQEKITMPTPMNISHKTINDKLPKRKSTPIVITVSSSTLLLSLVSLSLLSFSLLFLSFKDTTFWFFLSNSIILFIAAVDSDTFSPSKPKPDIYDEYVKSIRSRNTYSNNTYCTTGAVEPCSGDRRVCGDIDVLKENVTSPGTDTVSEKRESADMESVTEKGELVCYSVKKRPAREKYARSETAKAIVVVGGKRKKNSLRRSETEIGARRSEEGDLSAMSDEELNKRVEEFIQRFNREIRLQEINGSTN